MELGKGKVYKCWYEDGSYCLMFWDGELLNDYNDYCGNAHKLINFTKVEPYEPEAVDTLQEVVDWCKENEYSLCVNPKGRIVLGLLDYVCDVAQVFQSTKEVVSHIRQESKELTQLKALAEKLGYNLTKKD